MLAKTSKYSRSNRVSGFYVRPLISLGSGVVAGSSCYSAVIWKKEVTPLNFCFFILSYDR